MGEKHFFYNLEWDESVHSLHLSNIVLQVLSVAIRKETKSMQIGKKEINVSLFADHIILYLKDAENSIRKSLD